MLTRVCKFIFPRRPILVKRGKFYGNSLNVFRLFKLFDLTAGSMPLQYLMEHLTYMTSLAEQLRELKEEITPQRFATVILGSLPE